MLLYILHMFMKGMMKGNVCELQKLSLFATYLG
jgi:hypothetical protein